MKKTVLLAGLIAILVVGMTGPGMGLEGKGSLWFPAPAYASPGIFDPVPDPIAAGWTREGSEPFTAATPLVINDTSAVGYANFYIQADALFADPIVLQPNVTVDAGYVAGGDGNTGVHLTVNDGLREIRAVLLRSPYGLKVAIVTTTGFSSGFELGGFGGLFRLERRADGAGVLTVGAQSEVVLPVDQPGSRRLGVKTIEFGTYGVGASSVSRWQTLGLPQQPSAGSIVLNPEDISNFTLVGTQTPATGPQLQFTDAKATDVSGLYAAAPWAAIGTTVDIISTFQVTSQASYGVDAGFQLVINDGAGNSAAIMSAILINNLPHIGLVGTGPRDQLAAYPAFIQAEWRAAPLTVHLRRWADGSFEVLELNGAPPGQPLFLPAVQLPPATRAFGSIDFGAFSPPALVDARVSEFRAFTVPDSLPEILQINLDIKPGSSPNSISLNDHGLLPVAILGAGSYDVAGIDPQTIALGGVDIAMRGSAKAPKIAYSFEDINSDGIIDLVAFFEVQALVTAGQLTGTTVELTLTANLLDGTPVQGTDSVRIVP